MNKKDCDAIAYILADTDAPSTVRERFYAIDPRIEKEYEGYWKIVEQDRAIDALVDELMIEKLGYDWAVKKVAKEVLHEVYEQARREIIGDDNAPAKKKRTTNAGTDQ